MKKRDNLFRCLFFFLVLVPILQSCSSKKELRPDVFDAEATFAKANAYFDKKDYEEARSLYVEVKNRDLTKNYAPLAQLKIADSYVKGEEYDKAVDEYKVFLDIYPENKFASYAQYQIAMIYFDQIEDAERGYGAAMRSFEEFERLEKLYPRNPYRDVIPMRIEKSKTVIADYEFIVARFYFKKGSFAAALGRFLDLRTNFPDYNKEAEVLFYMAMTYKGLNNMEAAKEMLGILSSKYPQSPFVEKTKKELESAAK